jgi:hypothetical protein
MVTSADTPHLRPLLVLLLLSPPALGGHLPHHLTTNPRLTAAGLTQLTSPSPLAPNFDREWTHFVGECSVPLVVSFSQARSVCPCQVVK